MQPLTESFNFQPLTESFNFQHCQYLVELDVESVTGWY